MWLCAVMSWTKLLLYDEIRGSSSAEKLLSDSNKFESIRERDLPDTTSQEILIDEEVRLTGVETASKYPKKIRRIGIYNVQGGYTIDVYTNDFKHAASTIAALYRSRWKIEIFFRNLKQNLHIKSFLGTSQNAVEIQIWTALITILLLQYIAVR